MQNKLSKKQLEAFYHNEFVEDQVRDFISLLGASPSSYQVVDMGGGCGFFANKLKNESTHLARVVDMDMTSVKACHDLGVEAAQGDALAPEMLSSDEVVSFNLILHHLVGQTERDTLALQVKAMAIWKPQVKYIFINEYIYESFLPNFSGWLIYKITKNQILSWFGRTVSVVLPSLKANTFGVGVRFRSMEDWKRVFLQAGFSVKSAILGKDEHISLPRRILLIKAIRRDSYLLEPIGTR